MTQDPDLRAPEGFQGLFDSGNLPAEMNGKKAIRPFLMENSKDRVVQRRNSSCQKGVCELTVLDCLLSEAKSPLRDLIKQHEVHETL